MNVIDIYDIATTTWYKQATSGASPPIRVDPCAVVFAAPDASSFNIYLYGGQNLQPYRGQTQYTDLWILTVPSFMWIQVDLSGQSQPPARAGHTCHAWNGQMVVVGGYVGTQISCDSPGIYVFNATSLQWQNNYVALSGGDNQNEQATQNSGSGLSGSYGYEVPGAVQKVIGGGPFGSATATTPAAGSATAGPIATGRPPTFAITQSGSTIVETAHSTATATSISSSTPSASPPSSSSSPNIGVIIAAAIAGVLAVLAAYLAFCTWLYRRQLALYKNHVAISQRAALGYSNSPENRIRGERMGTILGAFGTEIGGNSGSNSAQRSSLGGNSGPCWGPPAARLDSNSTANRVLSSEEPTPTEYQGAAGVVAGSTGWPGETSDRGSMSSTEDLLAGHEPSFISVILSPRRTLRVINRD